MRCPTTWQHSKAGSRRIYLMYGEANEVLFGTRFH